MVCNKCIYWESGTKECQNNNVQGDKHLVYPECEDGYVEIHIKFEADFGCIFFKLHPERKT